MAYTYESELSPCLESHFPAACTVSAAPFCRPVLLEGFFLAGNDDPVRIFLFVLVATSRFHS